MHLHTTGVLDMLRDKTGRYIEHHKGVYVMRETDGRNVFIVEEGEKLPIHPSEGQIDDLVSAGHLIRDGQRYELS
ncbi:MAG TPA: hypothetical protein VK700_09880 [Steroidobacteraceae bacterium]|jgi:hypothetical protein|nr:hypothetical protein [Steroidobacteraceae bacterium]